MPYPRGGGGLDLTSIMSQHEEQWEQVEPEELEVGNLLRIDHRWFDHPFTRRKFRISSEKELEIIREVKIERMFVDRGEDDAFDETPADDKTAKAAAKAAPEIDRVAQRKALAGAQERDRVTLERAQQMLGMLSMGDPDSAKAMTGYVEFLVAILNNSTTPMAPMAPAAERRSVKRLALLGSDAVWLAGTIGKRMRLTSEALRSLTAAAAAHAVGLTRMPPFLMDEEPTEDFTRDSTFRNYPMLSAKIVDECGNFSLDTLRIVMEHRERPDGSGFPRGLAGNAIHPHALILGAVRELQVRCAGGKVSPALALAGIYQKLRDTYGAEIVNHLAASVLICPVGTHVLLSDGSIARIVRENETARLSPVVETYGQNAALNAPETIDLSKRRGLLIVRPLDTSDLPPKLFDSALRTDAGKPGGDAEQADGASIDLADDEDSTAAA